MIYTENLKDVVRMAGPLPPLPCIKGIESFLEERMSESAYRIKGLEVRGETCSLADDTSYHYYYLRFREESSQDEAIGGVYLDRPGLAAWPVNSEEGLVHVRWTMVYTPTTAARFSLSEAFVGHTQDLLYEENNKGYLAIRDKGYLAISDAICTAYQVRDSINSKTYYALCKYQAEALTCMISNVQSAMKAYDAFMALGFASGT